jgi:hypothetical protein
MVSILHLERGDGIKRVFVDLLVNHTDVAAVGDGKRSRFSQELVLRHGV